jgi:4-aminobutyrate aminotransferase-like enzyme
METLSLCESPALTTRRARRAELSGAPHDPIVWARAQGANVWDVDGNRYVDLSAGFGAAAIGHGHHAVVQAVQTQAAKLSHALGDLHPSDVKVALLDRLRVMAPFADARVMLGLSGSDAVTAALKTAALYTGRPGILAFEGGYHGLGYGPLAVCGYNEKFRAPFSAQLNPHVVFARYPDAQTSLHAAITAIEHAWQGHHEIGAVLVEPVQGRGGVVVPPRELFTALSSLCERRGALLIVDEVLTGLGRTGAMFASVAAGARPDLICLGKALGGGLPVSACLGRAEVMACWGDPGSEALHTGTFFGNPLGCAAALATLGVIENDALCARAADLGQWLLDQLRTRVGRRVQDVRGCGLLIGIELDTGAAGLRLVRALLERGYIVLPAGSDARVVSLTPPLTIAKPLLEGFLETLTDALDAVLP